MIDLKREVFRLLQGIGGVQVSYQMPKSLAELPMITYYEHSNTPAANGDDGEYVSRIVHMVDVWSHSPEELTHFAGEVDRILTREHYIRRFAGELYDPAGVYRKSMRYERVL